MVRLVDDVNAAEIRILSRRSSSTFDPAVETGFLSLKRNAPMKVSISNFDSKEAVADFVEFVRKQGAIGLAVGFILGGAVAKFWRVR
jgi:hypothetical protein